MRRKPKSDKERIDEINFRHALSRRMAVDASDENTTFEEMFDKGFRAAVKIMANVLQETYEMENSGFNNNFDNNTPAS